MTSQTTFNHPSEKDRSLTIQTFPQDQIVYTKTQQPNMILPIDGGCFGSVGERRRGQRRRVGLSVNTFDQCKSPSPLSPLRIRSKYNPRTPTRTNLPTSRRPPTRRTPSDNLLTFSGMDEEFLPETAASWSSRVRVLLEQQDDQS
ncbi:hypothetical protein C1H76_7181 [Elsinoe australis]|uniref:Uncharacterized protein n=1 Tax=Elsinoe australis TaxID=40998 RepID=A0A4U7ARC7_9PEZI|nr:hypothetical protein C1H76_7181 [Elsinoe australis]